MPSNLTSPEPFSALSADSKINDILLTLSTIIWLPLVPLSLSI